MDLTIIVPLFNEAESLPELVRWINRTLDGRGWEYEIIMVDDGSTDGSWNLRRLTGAFTESVSDATTASPRPSTTVSRLPGAMS